MAKEGTLAVARPRCPSSLVKGVASAHETPDAAEDTPLVGATAGAVDNFLAALEHSEAENSLLRNPTCGAHNSPDGIHPPGNP